MERLLKAVVRYDGTHFDGWQVQPDRRTVQGDIEHALSTIAQCPVRIQGAGRTDSGVHAMAQVFHCPWDDMSDLDKIARSLSKMLSPDIYVRSIVEAPPDFHAIHSAKSKRYSYVIHRGAMPDPFSCRYAWSAPHTVDAEGLHGLAQSFVGRHDFAGLTASGSSAKTTERTIFSIDIVEGPLIGPRESPDYFQLVFNGDGFLYKMIRNITGTLYDVARGRLPEGRIEEALASPGPYHGYTAPAHGLFLVKVTY